MNVFIKKKNQRRNAAHFILLFCLVALIIYSIGKGYDIISRDLKVKTDSRKLTDVVSHAAFCLYLILCQVLIRCCATLHVGISDYYKRPFLKSI